MLSNAYFLAKFRFETAENEPAKNSQNFRKMHFRKMYFRKMHFRKMRLSGAPGGAVAGPLEVRPTRVFAFSSATVGLPPAREKWDRIDRVKIGGHDRPSLIPAVEIRSPVEQTVFQS